MKIVSEKRTLFPLGAKNKAMHNGIEESAKTMLASSPEKDCTSSPTYKCNFHMLWGLSDRYDSHSSDLAKFTG
jgi:hypothetical protein